MGETLDQTEPGATAPPQPQRWLPRPVAARAVRIATRAVPVVLGVLVALVIGRVAGRPSSFLPSLVWWLTLALAAIVTVVLVDLAMDRVRPLAGLLELSLTFPGVAPSRRSIIVRSAAPLALTRRAAEVRKAGLPADPDEAIATVLELVVALEHHDRSALGHTAQVQAYAGLIARQLELSDDLRIRLEWAAVVHDIGKLAIPADILGKTAPPDEAEWAAVQRHALAGERLLAPLVGFLGDAVHATGQHHERWDGHGYPRNLEGGSIAWTARIVAVADAAAVMSSGTSYRARRTVDEVRAELERCAGHQFDPTVVSALLEVPAADLPLTAPAAPAFLDSLHLPAPLEERATPERRALGARALGSLVLVILVTIAPIPVLHGLAATSDDRSDRASAPAPDTGTTQETVAETEAPEPSVGFLVVPSTAPDISVDLDATVAPEATAAPETTAPPAAEPVIMVSASADRAGATPLEAATLSGPVFVFVSDAPGITKVDVRLTDNFGTVIVGATPACRPWDLVPGADPCTDGVAGPARPFDLTTLGAGGFRVYAVIERDGASSELVATFTVA